MTATRIKRGGTTRKAAPKRKVASKRAARQKPSMLATTMGGALDRLPISHDQAEKLTTIAILGLAGAILVAIASFMGLPGMIRQEVALAAGRAGFEVKTVEVRNVKKMDELAVYEIVLAEKDRSMPLVDLEALRQDLLQLGWIRDARVSRELPDTLVVDIVEREPKAVWDNGQKLVLIDEEGVALETVRSGENPDMLRIAGKQANAKVAELTTLLDAAPALTPEVAAAEWIGNRRWNLTFRTGEVLALPEGEETAAAALINFARLEGVNRLLGQGVTYFDLRDPRRAYVRKPKPADVAAAPEAVGPSDE